MEGGLRAGADAPGLKLIETMLWDGAAFPRRAGHMARLARGAAALGWGCPMAAVMAALEGLPGTPARVRLTLDRAGQVRVETAPLPQAKRDWRIGLAPGRLFSGDPWLGVKTTHRAAYDAARAALPEGLDEVVFLNERGEVCDGTITTVFFDKGEGMMTPPLSSGVLPGVLRAEMLAAGHCREAVLRGEDLPRVRLWVGNALRGLIPAVWGGPVI